MKMFKKLMAIALAGVMALAVLTGCGTSLNEKEIIKQMNDELKFGAAFGSTSSTYYGKYKEFKADKEMGAKAVTIAKKVAEKATTQAEITAVLQSDDVKNILVGEDDTNVYKVSYVKSISYGSKYYQTNKDSLDLTVLWLNAISRNDVGREVKDAVVGVGFADATVGGSVYTIVVMKVPTQKA